MPKYTYPTQPTKQQLLEISHETGTGAMYWWTGSHQWIPAWKVLIQLQLWIHTGLQRTHGPNIFKSFNVLHHPIMVLVYGSSYEIAVTCIEFLTLVHFDKWYRWYPAKRALPAMLTHGRWGPFCRIPSIYGSHCYLGFFLTVSHPCFSSLLLLSHDGMLHGTLGNSAWKPVGVMLLLWITCVGTNHLTLCS